MPGIVGIVTALPPEEARRQVVLMLETMRHEPFYETGIWSDESLGVYVGWTAREKSFSAGMPVRNEQGNVVLVFSGEDFPEPGIVGRLRERGHAVDTDGPSYLVHQYEEDSTFPAGLNGRFQGLVTDSNRGTSTLFNDRYGMHRVYYHESKEGFYFAAEAKAILAARPELRTPNLQGLGELVSNGCTLENRTLFQGIYVLPPASAWVFQGKTLAQKSSYFAPAEWEQQSLLDPESYYKELRDVFARNLPRYFSGPEKVGMSLTGGLDTRMMMSWQKSQPGTLPCYSFGGSYRDCQDVLIARKVAQACQQPHEVIPVGKEFLSNFSRYAERTVYITDGCVGLAFSPDLYVNQRAAKIAPVRMTGNYGGEVMRRVRAFKPSHLAADLFQPELQSYIAKARATYDGLLDGHPLSFAVFRQAPWHHYGLLSLEQSQLSLRSPFLDNDFVRTVFRAPESCCVNDDLCLRLIKEGDAAMHRIRTDRGLAGEQGATEAAITHGLMEFTFKAEYAYDYGMPQWVSQIDHLLSPLQLERLFLGRHKFKHFRVWYRDDLSAYVREMLLDPLTLSRPYLNRRTVEGLVRGHLTGGQNHTMEIHQLLNLELIQRAFFDR